MPQASHHVQRRLTARASRSQSETCAGCIVSATTSLEVGAQRRRGRPARAAARRRPSSVRCGVVAAAVEAPVDEPLHARAQRQEQRGDDERRAGDREVRAARERREHRLAGQHEPGVGGAEDHRQRAVDERLRDHAVDLVEAVAQHRDPDRDRGPAARRCRVSDRGDLGRGARRTRPRARNAPSHDADGRTRTT